MRWMEIGAVTVITAEAEISESWYGTIAELADVVWAEKGKNIFHSRVAPRTFGSFLDP